MNDSTSNLDPVLFQGKIFNVVERTQKGRDGRPLKRQIVKHPGAVGIVPILPDGRVLLIEQYRASFEQILFEIPAGTREKGEAPETTAQRELVEETGYRVGQMEMLTPIYTSPGILQEELIIYLATDLTEGQSAPELGELITLAPKTWEEIDEMLRRRTIMDAKTIVGLLLAKQRLEI